MLARELDTGASNCVNDVTMNTADIQIFVQRSFETRCFFVWGGLKSDQSQKPFVTKSRHATMGLSSFSGTDKC